MTQNTPLPLQEQLARLEKQMEEAKACGHRGEQMAQLIEGDLRRLISSAWLNLYELVDDHKKLSCPDNESTKELGAETASGLKSDKYLDVHSV